MRMQNDIIINGKSLDTILALHNKFFRKGILSLFSKGQIADLSGCDLHGAQIQKVNLNGANLSGANLITANLSGSSLIGTLLNGANLYRATLIQAQFIQLRRNGEHHMIISDG